MGIPSEQAEANAKAIANLPNTLKENESLKAINAELLDLLRDIVYNLELNAAWDKCGQAYYKAKEAITKATKQ